jgi:signal transduction histidine kinase
VLPDGAIRYIHTAAVIERDEAGAPQRVVGVNQDVTQQKAHERLLEETNAELERQVAERTADLRATVEELRRADAGKDAFLAAVSHELRTPLVGVLGMAELLGAEVRGPLNPEQARYVAAIEDSGRRLLSLVNNLLLYTHLMSGGEALTRETCCLADLCAAAVNAIRPQAERKQHRITQRIDPFDLSIESNAEGIINMLKMLLDNAVKFTPAGGRIEVTIWEASPEHMVHIDIADNGIGMTPAEIASLFRPFSQVDNSLSRRYEGVGIGLAFVRKMVELLGGAIAVQSKTGEGSRFSVMLPRQ